MKKLRAGVIGLGMGKHHADMFDSHPHCKLAAIADLDETRLKTYVKGCPSCKPYTSTEEMLKKESLDIVSIATPNKLHRPLALAAFDAGCHVLCEKPMAMNAQEAREMLKAAEQAKRRLMINFSFRFNAHSQAMKREAESGALGDVYFARTIWLRRSGMPGRSWFGQKALSGGGPLIDLGVHRLDLALWLMGYPKPVWVLGRTWNHLAKAYAQRQKELFDVEDCAAALITFENGAALELEASWAGHIREHELMETRLMGSQAGLVHRGLNEGYEFDSEVYLERNGIFYDLKPHNPVPLGGCAMHELCDAILNDTPHPATGEEGLVVMELLDAIYESAEKGEPVRLT